jgi:hypothetical protein
MAKKQKQWDWRFQILSCSDELKMTQGIKIEKQQK